MAGFNPSLHMHQIRLKGGKIDFLHGDHLEGVMLMPGISASDVSELREKMVIRPDDVFIVTYP